MASDGAGLLLAAIVESSTDAIVSKDLNGIVTSWNRSAELIFGYSAAEMIGRSITTIIPAELQGDEARILAKIRAGERIDHFETVRMRKDGTRIQVSLTVSPVRDESGRIVGAAKIARDVTSERQAMRTSLHLAAIVESSDDAIISKDLNGRVTSWNQSAERIFGYTAQEMIGRPITTIIPPELQDDEPRILAKIRAGERIDHFQTVRVRKSGERIDVSLTVSPVRDGQGLIIGAAKIARDITEQKRMQAALHTAERLASVGRLAATVAHEINNPLEAVTNLIYLAKQETQLGDTALRYLKSADEELARVAHIAQQTLGFYRDWSEPVHVDVQSVVQDVLGVYERKFRYKDLQVDCRISDGVALYTWRGELKQALSNLISNAIDASHPGGRIVIAARSWRNPGSGATGVRLSVADYGVGIPEQSRSQIFAPFFTSKREMGTGLGLWITKELLEKRGGRLRFRSRESKPSGTVMSIFLPAARSESAAA